MKNPLTKTRFSLLRFSLRFLLLIVFLVACVLGWISWKIQTAKAELHHARELDAAGCTVGWSNFENKKDAWPEPGWNYNWLRNHLSSHVNSLRFYESEIESLDSLKAI